MEKAGIEEDLILTIIGAGWFQFIRETSTPIGAWKLNFLPF